ncbi:hypothetical protein [Salinibacter altiplanensis]|uniref:hypothetical protein n=1 Tax=Salinibacter altiplanensis TaxID=1803181 RepID=UPI000C9F295E|nr:hypothetical protein [Salinibacter altiplanensis]
MALSHQQKQQVIDYLQENARAECPLCEGHFEIHDRLLMPQAFEHGETERGGGIPLVIGTCGNCGNTQFFSAEVVGIDLNEA